MVHKMAITSPISVFSGLTFAIEVAKDGLRNSLVITIYSMHEGEIFLCTVVNDKYSLPINV